jgi:hypothetical protein
LLRFPFEKSKDRFDDHWPFLFNAVINTLDLREVSMVGRQFTWANNLLEPTYEKLDRILMDSDWEDKYPMVSVRALERIESLSDHAPILLTTGSTIPHWLVVSNLNLDGFTGRVFMIRLSLFGSIQLLVGPQSKGGKVKFDLFENTWVAGRDTQPGFKKRKKFEFRLS